MELNRQSVKEAPPADHTTANALTAFAAGGIDRHQLHQILAEESCGWLEGAIRHSAFLSITGEQFRVKNFSQGWTNITFEVSSGSAIFIAKVALGINGQRIGGDVAEWSMFEKERHWQGVLRQRDTLLSEVIPEHFGCIYLPTDSAPALLADYTRQSGTDTMAVSLQRKLSGQPAWSLPDSKRHQAYSWLGKIAAAINQVETSGLGSSYSVEHERFFYHVPTEAEDIKSRVSFLAGRARESLEQLGMSHEKQLAVTELIERFEMTEFSPRLVFGDYNKGNFLCHPDSGKISALFDFETIRSDLGIQDELSGIFLSLPPDEYEAFLRGYSNASGVTSEVFAASWADDILASAWIRALAADAGRWKQSALQQLGILLDNKKSLLRVEFI